MVKQVVFFLIVLAVGLFLGIFVVGPVFRADHDIMPENEVSAADSFDDNGKAAKHDSLLKSLQKRQSQEALKRYRLQERIVELENQLVKLQLIVASLGNDEHDAEEEPEERAVVEKENEPDREAQLVAVGMEPLQAKLIMRYLGEIEMERLYLQDRATREGWMGTSRYREEFLVLRQREKNIRQEFGDNDYDLYLFGSEQKNRVVIQSVIAGSPASEAGIQVGDIAYSYAGSRLFAVHDLKTATTEGSAGELVAVEIVRDSDIITVYLPRGPMGVRLKSESMRP